MASNTEPPELTPTPRHDEEERRHHHAHITKEILVAWIQQRPASTAGAEIVAALKDSAIEAAAEICRICARVAEDPEDTARRDKAERKEAERKAAKEAKERAEQEKKDAQARAQLAKQNES